MALLQCFRSSQEGSLCGRLLAIRQEGSVAKYRRKFEMSVAPLRDVPDEILEGIFVNGLMAEVWAELRLLKPVSLGEIMEIAQRSEEKNELLRREVVGSKFSRPQYLGVSQTDFQLFSWVASGIEHPP